MFYAWDFIYAGTSASEFGLFICDVGGNGQLDIAFANKANILQTRLSNRIEPIMQGVRWNDNPLTFTLVFGSTEPMDRYQLQAVAQWLTGYQEYQWLQIEQPDMEHIQFRCLVESLKPISVGWFPVAFEAKIVCDSPYGYSFPFEKSVVFDDQKKFRFYNDSTARVALRPKIKLELAAGCRNFALANETNGLVMRFTDLPSGVITINIDNNDMIISGENNEYNLYDYFNFQFMEFVPGDNELIFEGAGKATISGRYVYNVGA